MADDNKIEGEVKFNYREVTLGVNELTRLLGQIEDRGSRSGKIIDDLRGRFGNIADQISLSKLETGLDNLAKRGAALFSAFAGKGGAFQSELNQIQTIANLDSTQLESFGDRLRYLGRELGVAVSPTEALAGAYQTLSSNFTDAAQAERVLGQAMVLASAGRADQVKSVDLLAGTLNSYNLGADEATAVTDKFFQTVNLGTTTIPELADRLGDITASAYSAGISLDELLGALATTTTRGIRTGASIDGLNGVIQAIVRPTEQAREEFQRLGVSVDAATLRSEGLLKTLSRIGQASKGDISSLSRIFEDRQARNVASSLITAKGDFQANTEKIADSAGSAAKAVETTSKGFEQSLKRMQVAAENFAISGSKAILPVLTTITDRATDAVEALDGLPNVLKGGALAAVAVGTGLAAAAAGTLFFVGQLVALNANLLAAGINVGAYAARQAVAIALTAQLAYATGGLNGVLKLVAGTAAFQAAVLAGLGGGVIAMALAYSKATDELIEYERALDKASTGIKNFQDAQGQTREIKDISRNDALTLSAKELADRGFDADDLTQALQNARKRAEESDNEAVRQQFAKEVKALREKRELLIEELKKRDQEQKASAGTVDPVRFQTDKEEKAARDEKYRDELQAIELSKRGHAEKVQQLEELKARYADDGDKRRNIERQIAQEQDAAANALTKRLQENQQAIERGLEETRKQEKQAQKEREDELQRLADLKEKAAQAEIDRTERTLDELGRLRERGVDTEAAELAAVEEQRRRRKEQIDAQLEKDLAKEKSPTVQAELRKQAKAEKADSDTGFDSQARDIQERARQDRLSQRQEIVDGERGLADLRIQILQQQLSEGKAVEAQLKAAVLERLALQEEEIRLQAELVRAQSSDPARIQLAEQQAQAAIYQARKDANEEIKRGTELLQEQKKARDANKDGGEFSGRILSLEQFIEGERKRFESKPQRATTPTFIPGVDVKSAEQALLQQRGVAGGAAGAAQTLVAQTVVNGQFVVEVQLPTGERVAGKMKSVTLDGRGSELANAGRNIGSVGGLGGF